MPEGYNFRAVLAINHNGVRAYNVGDLVPDENVSIYGYDKDGLVERLDAKPSKADSKP